MAARLGNLLAGRMRRPSRRSWVLLLGTSATLLALVYADYRRDIGRAYARIATGSEILETPCGPVEYATRGAGPPLLSIHGAGGGFDQGLELAEPLVERGFRVIAISRFGYLRSPLPADASAQAQADAYVCVLDSLGIDRAAILGTSAGGPSAMQFALRHPDRTAALVLLVPAAFAPRSDGAGAERMSGATSALFDTALRSDFLFWAMGKVSHDLFVRAILGTPPAVVAKASPKERARIERILDHILPVRPRRLGLVNDAAVVSSLPRYDLEKIAAPTLAISVPDDLYGTFPGARYTAEHVARGRFVGYADGGHMLVGHNAAATEEIAAFLEASAEF
jgi:2-hydroxy-6-oxonona-2,4-dienedioate hydrolase